MYNYKRGKILKNTSGLDKSRVRIEGSTGGLIFLIIFLILIESLLIWSVITKTGDGANGINLTFMIISLTILVILVFSIQFLFYKVFGRK